MLKRLLILFSVAILLLLAVLLFRMYREKPWPVYADKVELAELPDSAVAHFSRAIRIQTISTSDSSFVDTAAFNEFRLFAEQAYPLVHQSLSRTMIRDFSFLYEWKGTDSSLAPILLMSHYDVVPVAPSEVEKWTVPPFSGRITDSCVWGRGTTDDKFGVISILEATEAMLRQGFRPRRTIYLCFGHDEENAGRGSAATVDWLQAHKIKPEFVLDEGGQLTESRVREVSRPLAMIGVAEKGYASFRLSVDKPGGHSSMPETETAIDILSHGLTALRAATPERQFTPELRAFSSRIGSSSNQFVTRLAASNLWLFGPLIRSKIAAEPEGDAMMHTTLVPTIIRGGIKDNVIPSHAEAIVNSRIMPGESAASVESLIRKLVDDDRVVIEKVGNYNSEPSSATSTSSPAFRRLESALYRTVPGVIPCPYLMIGATDSRHYRRISDAVVNFLPMTDAKGYHGMDERLPIRDLHRGISFIMTLISESEQNF